MYSIQSHSLQLSFNITLMPTYKRSGDEYPPHRTHISHRLREPFDLSNMSEKDESLSGSYQQTTMGSNSSFYLADLVRILYRCTLRIDISESRSWFPINGQLSLLCDSQTIERDGLHLHYCGACY